jgi:hypothetical protein
MFGGNGFGSGVYRHYKNVGNYLVIIGARSEVESKFQSEDPTALNFHTVSGFGGLVVSMLASGAQDRGLEPGRSRRIFRVKKVLREVKPSVPCRRFAEPCDLRGSRNRRQN